jgi:hypothetical protein
MQEKVRRVVTENAEVEQWRLLSRLAYSQNIRTYRDARGEPPMLPEDEEYVGGCLRQAQAYFEAAASAPIDISPLLLYYGAVSLLGAGAALVTGSAPTILNHGMRLEPPADVAQLGDVRLRASSSPHGGLQAFSDVYSAGCRFGAAEEWSLREVLGSVPDLKLDAEICYGLGSTYAVPIEVVRSGDRVAERVLTADLGQRSVDEALGLIVGLQQSYLSPQPSPDRQSLMLHRRIGSDPLGTRSLSGQRYLQLAHVKQSAQVSPSMEVLLHMGLFVLGTISRYHPSLWNPFVRSDDTGEMLIIERFLSVSRRLLPNLVLDAIHDERYVFVQPTPALDDQ